jgi:hypothetical protein
MMAEITSVKSMPDTSAQYDRAAAECRDIFMRKMKDYGPSWRILRPSSITDQLFIKANRIRSLEEKGVSRVGEGIRPEYVGLVNYSIMGLIQLESGAANEPDLSTSEAECLYDRHLAACKALMEKKNHDYGEAWRDMRIKSLTDLILVKIHRIRQIEDNEGRTEVSEGIESNLHDMINYAIFALIKMGEA